VAYNRGCFCPPPLSQTYHIRLSSITVCHSASSYLNIGNEQLAKAKSIDQTHLKVSMTLA
jgi:hypothetical protein